MEDIQLKLNEGGKGGLYFMADEEQMGEMVISIANNDLTVYHTEVKPEYEGQGIAKKLLNSLTGYAREHHMKIIPLCPYVLAQFKRHPDEYKDVWKKTDRSED